MVDLETFPFSSHGADALGQAALAELPGVAGLLAFYHPVDGPADLVGCGAGRRCPVVVEHADLHLARVKIDAAATSSPSSPPCRGHDEHSGVGADLRRRPTV